MPSRQDTPGPRDRPFPGVKCLAGCLLLLAPRGKDVLMKRFAIFVIFLFGSFAAGCGDDRPTTPSTTTPTDHRRFLRRNAVVDGLGAEHVHRRNGRPRRSHPPDAHHRHRAVAGVPVALSVGTLSGTACTPTTTVNATAALKAQLATALAAGTFCVNVADLGTVTEDLSFSLRVVQLPSSGTPTSTTDTFSSNVTPRGSASRTVYGHGRRHRHGDASESRRGGGRRLRGGRGQRHDRPLHGHDDGDRTSRDGDFAAGGSRLSTASRFSTSAT